MWLLTLALACPGPSVEDSATPADGGAADGGVQDGGATDGGVQDGGVADGGAEEWPSGALVLDHVRVVDAATVREAAAVVVAGHEIWAVTDAGQPWPADAVVQDWSHLADATVVPGLVDSHTHLFHSGATWWVGDTLADNLQAQLHWGVTAVIDLGSPVEVYDLRDRIAEGSLRGPRILATGPMLTAELSHPCETVDDPALCRYLDGDAEDEVAGLARADALKAVLADADFTAWPTPRLDLGDLAELVEAGHAAGQPVLVHIDEPEDALDALAAGVDVLAHPVFSEELSAADRAVVATAPTMSTVSAFANLGALLDGSLLEGDLSATPEAVIAAWEWLHLHPEELEDGFAESSAQWAAAARANLAALVEDGAVVLAGSDAGYWWVPHGLGLHMELDELVAAGLSPQQALAAATSLPAAWAGWEDLGFVAAGYRADLLVVQGRPDEDIAALHALRAVYLGGERLEAGDPWLAAGDGDFCLDSRDCPAPGRRCDLLDHRCRDSCDLPYARVGHCDAETWCMPEDALVTTAEGVCHPGDACDLVTQDCTPASYQESCIPVDLDTNRCWPGGPRQPGQTCSYDDPDLYCEQGSFCSWVDYRCYALCDPGAAPTEDCPRCVQQTVAGEPWFGICL